MKRAMTPLMNGSRHDDHCPGGTVANHLRHAMFVGLSTLSTRENCREVGMTYSDYGRENTSPFVGHPCAVSFRRNLESFPV